MLIVTILVAVAIADRVKPAFASVTITSNNTNSRRARPNNLITLSFTTSETVETSLLVVKFSDENTVVTASEVANSNGTSWVAEYVASINAQVDGSPINFTITAQDLAGNQQTTTDLTDNATVIFYSTRTCCTEFATALFFPHHTIVGVVAVLCRQRGSRHFWLC